MQILEVIKRSGIAPDARVERFQDRKEVCARVARKAIEALPRAFPVRSEFSV